jgi:hypothetical protein
MISELSIVNLRLAEEVIDHVNYGQTRGEHVREIASMIEDAYRELISAAASTIAAAESSAAAPDLSELREALQPHLDTGERYLAQPSV